MGIESLKDAGKLSPCMMSPQEERAMPMDMHFHRSAAVELTLDETVCRQSTEWPLVAAVVSFLAGTAGAAVVVVARNMPSLFALAGAAFLFFYGTLCARMYARARGPANWLLAFNRRRLLIKYRSYMNASLAPDIPDVVELDRSMIAGVRAMREEFTGRGSDGETTRQTVMYLDVQLAPGVDAAELRERLRTEQTLHHDGAVWRDYPVSLIDDSTIRVEWRSERTRVVPALHAAISALTPNADSSREIRLLVQQGRVMEAVGLARRILDCDVTGAKRYVDQLSRGVPLSP
jgi:hypothetical protein